MKLTKHMIAAALLVALPCAQSGNAPADPADPHAAVPQVRYRSAFADYRPIGNERVGDWKAANDTVGRIGGWKVYARERPDDREPARATGDSPPGAGASATQPAAPAGSGRRPHH